MALFSKKSPPWPDLDRSPDSKALLKKGKAHCKKKEYDRAITCFSDGLQNLLAPPDVRKACFDALKRLADQGFQEAQTTCAWYYFQRAERMDATLKDRNGKECRVIINIRVVPHSLPLAIYYYSLAAQQGSLEAMKMLPRAYLMDEARNPAVNRQQAVYWTMQVAERGSASAAIAMGLFNYLGIAMKEDPERAMWWFREAEARGDSFAKTILKIQETHPDHFRSFLADYYELTMLR